MKRKTVLVVALIAVGFGFASRAPRWFQTLSEAYAKANEEAQREYEARIAVKDFGDGVYFFPRAPQNFGRRLVEFKHAHPDLAVVSIVAVEEVQNNYRYIAGYVVNTEPRRQ